MLKAQKWYQRYFCDVVAGLRMTTKLVCSTSTSPSSNWKIPLCVSCPRWRCFLVGWENATLSWQRCIQIDILTNPLFQVSMEKYLSWLLKPPTYTSIGGMNLRTKAGIILSKKSEHKVSIFFLWGFLLHDLWEQNFPLPLADCK